VRWFGWLRKRQIVGTGLIEAVALQEGTPVALQEGTPVALQGGRMRTIGLLYAPPRDPCHTIWKRLIGSTFSTIQHYMLR
jgi:hypothetical protein